MDDSRARHILDLHRRGLLRGTLGLAALAAVQPAAPPRAQTAAPGPDLGVRRFPFTLGVARPYWYRFRAGHGASPAGRTRTAPAAEATPARLRFVNAGCLH